MALDHGTGVSRTLSPLDRMFGGVIWQKGKPPLDAELNLMGSLEMERLRQFVAAQMPSGFFMDPTRAEFDFKFDKKWANHFQFGVPRASKGTLDADETQPVVWANVNGWIIPVAGTDITDAAGVHNVVKLYPPPESDGRVDLVFLEAWATLVQPNPSTVNKPSASTVWKYGNVKHGGTNLADDLEDPAVGAETTKRVQVQYRIRVFGEGIGQGAGVNLAVHPDGLTDPNVLGQGAAAAPVSGYQWKNMREELGDPSLWRAGTGDANSVEALGTLDGYTYAIPICAIFRRASETYVAVVSSGNPKQNGAFLRTPGSKSLTNPLDGARPLLTATLGAALGPDDGKTADFTIAVNNLNGSGLEDTALVLSSTFLRIGDEIVGISGVDLIQGQITIPSGGRGRWGTAAVGHPEDTAIEFFNTRPDGLFADEVAAQDVLDLRRAVNAGDWDYNRLLAHNVAALAKGKLRTSWKASNPGDTEGPVVHEVCEMYAGNTATPNHTDPVDGPDGIRTVWSDAATLQPDVTLLLAHDEARDPNGLVGFTTGSLDTDVEWDVGADFKPAAHMNTGGGADGWYNGSSIHLWIGGSTGEGGARGTFRASGVEDVRFVTPNEYWKTGYPVADPSAGNQYPFTLRFLGEKQHQAPPASLPDDEKALYPGPMYPWREARFERPFIVLGGLLNSALHYEGVDVASYSTAVVDGVTRHYLDLSAAGVDFDAAGGFNNASGGVFPNDPDQVATPVLRGHRTLYGMLTNEGRDRSGASSEVYLLVYGDPDDRDNNGAFRVIGAGTAGYTHIDAPNAGSLVIEPLSADFTAFVTGSGNTVTVDMRSQWHNADDVSDYDARIADCVVVLTDIGGEGAGGTPWDIANVGGLALQTAGGAYYAPSKAVLSTTLLYHPGRSATARVPDHIVRFAMRGGAEDTLGSYLRRSPSTLDTTFSAIGTATDETYWPTIHVQTWNRLSALGWHAPTAPAYGGDVVGFTEQDREAEVFVDRGSKTVIFRPFRNRDMTLQALTWDGTEFDAGDCLLGTYTFDNVVGAPVKDPLNILTGVDGGGQGTSGKRMGFPIPREFMPRFGRQDIPYYKLVDGAAPTLSGFMPGINHLFTDVTDLTNPVFNIIGGEANDGGTEVNPLFLVTRSTEIAYARSNASYGPKGVGALGARKTTDIDPAAGVNARTVIGKLNAVNSSDLGRGLRGIQMPPYVGIARLYGVYEFEDYQNKGGTSFASNRYEMEANSAVNLIREDADKQTLFILQDGALDFTGEVDDHTYVIPSNVLDLRRIPAAPGKHDGFVEGTSEFGDFDYVVECTVFFFSKGFINKTNTVLVRKRNGSFGLNTDGDNPELENVPMCIPSPAGVNDRLYVAYNRTVYQGDPYMTRDGTTRQEADYENRYGRLSPSQSWLLRTAVQQFDSSGNFVPQMENERAFEVLASMDFYTTLGTGKIGGDLFPGTPLDVGHIANSTLAASRMPLTEDAKDWRVGVRAFTEGQKENTSRAKATVEVLDNAALLTANGNDDTFFVRFTLLDGTSVTLWGASQGYADNVLTLAPHLVPADDIFIVDTTRNDRHIVYQFVNRDFGTLTPAAGSSAVTFTLISSTHPEVDDIPAGTPISVLVNPDQRYTLAGWGDVIFTGRYVSGTDIEVTAHFPVQPTPFATLDPDTLRNVRTLPAWDPADIPSDGEVTQTFAWAGADPTADQVFIVEDNTDSPVYITAYASAADQITLRIKNLSGANQNLPSTEFRVAMLSDVDLAAASIDLSSVTFTLDVSWEQGSKNITADNLVEAINNNVGLNRTVKAFNDGTPKVTLEAIPTGAEGNGISVEVGVFSWGATVGDAYPTVDQVLKLAVPASNELPVGHNVTSTNLFGGVDLPVNAGDGTSQIDLTGMTERLPLGVLVQDNDFLCENPLRDTASAMNAAPSPLRPIQTLVPLTGGGEEYSRFLGAPGELVAMADVQVAPISWAAWTEDAPDGATKKFRIYRGGGAAFVLSGDNPGGPIDWVSESFPKSSQPVLKGGILACRAMLVRNFYEEALPADGPAKVSDGDEIQMVVLTHAQVGDGNSVQEGVTLNGIISPSGYGEGYAAADRYRIMGRPMFRGYSREVPDPSAVTLAVYPEDQRGEE